eukprot:Sspe_Gene.7423::Locus_2513_Transcript_1_1_Confidence_1.000_Length_2280::g.7423::m.7423
MSSHIRYQPGMSVVGKGLKAQKALNGMRGTIISVGSVTDDGSEAVVVNFPPTYGNMRVRVVNIEPIPASHVLRQNMKVLVQGLEKLAHLNGRPAVVKDVHADLTVTVSIDSEELRLRRKNYSPALGDEEYLPSGIEIETAGLVNNTELNGMTGQVVGHIVDDKGEKCPLVHLPSKKTMRFSPKNLRYVCRAEHVPQETAATAQADTAPPQAPAADTSTPSASPSASLFPVGTRVTAIGLVNDKSLNGQGGVVREHRDGALVIQFDFGKYLCVQPKNLLLEVAKPAVESTPVSSSTPPAKAATPQITAGCKVEAHSLVNQKELNGKVGSVLTIQEVGGEMQLVVQFDSGPRRLRYQNVRRVDDSAATAPASTTTTDTAAASSSPAGAVQRSDVVPVVDAPRNRYNIKDQDRADCEGMLQKKPGRGLKGNMDTRYFRLKDGVLSYYEKKGEVDLNQGCEVNVGQDFDFSVRALDGTRSYELRAPTMEKKEQWIQCLNGNVPKSVAEEVMVDLEREQRRRADSTARHQAFVARHEAAQRELEDENAELRRKVGENSELAAARAEIERLTAELQGKSAKPEEQGEKAEGLEEVASLKQELEQLRSSTVPASELAEAKHALEALGEEKRRLEEAAAQQSENPMVAELEQKVASLREELEVTRSTTVPVAELEDLKKTLEATKQEKAVLEAQVETLKRELEAAKTAANPPHANGKVEEVPAEGKEVVEVEPVGKEDKVAEVPAEGEGEDKV